jgi:hypothetical protein
MRDIRDSTFFKFSTYTLAGIGVVIFIAFYIFVGAWITKALWNWVVPSVFERREISYFEGLGLFLIISFLSSMFSSSKSK